MGDHLVLDVGNTTVQYGRYSCGKIIAQGQLVHKGRRLGADHIDRLFVGITRVTGASVAGSLAQALFAQHTQAGLVRWVTHEHIPLINTTMAPHKVGIDRLINSYAAWRKGRGTLVIDVGSAVTIDAVSPDGRFLGGVIAPGPELQLLSLHEHTAALPALKVSGAFPPKPLGRSTEQAMIGGVLHGLLGAITHISAQLRAEVGGDPVMVLTGGYAPLLADVLYESGYCHEPNLILDGLFRLESALWGVDSSEV